MANPRPLKTEIGNFDFAHARFLKLYDILYSVQEKAQTGAET